MPPTHPADTARSRPRPLGSPIARGRDRGMSTAEYALGTVTACAFAAALYLILTSPQIQETLTQLVNDALQIAG